MIVCWDEEAWDDYVALQKEDKRMVRKIWVPNSIIIMGHPQRNELIPVMILLRVSIMQSLFLFYIYYGVVES